MKIAISGFGLQFAAGYDKELARAEAIDRAARKIIATETRAAEIAVRAEQLKREEADRMALINRRVAQLKAAAADPDAPVAPPMEYPKSRAGEPGTLADDIAAHEQGRGA